MKVKAPFAGHPVASSAWTPAVTPSPRGGLESHCNKERQRRFVKINQVICNQRKSKLICFPSDKLKRQMSSLVCFIEKDISHSASELFTLLD